VSELHHGTFLKLCPFKDFLQIITEELSLLQDLIYFI